MFGSLYFILIKYQLRCQVSNAGTDVCVCVCARVLGRDHFNCLLIPAESTLNTYCLINNASLYKALLLFVYTHNENKTDYIYMYIQYIYIYIYIYKT